MFSVFRNRFGIPGVISVIALVFAMAGGAVAANNLGGSGGSKATASAKAKRGPKGPKGAKGATGPAGAPGPTGPQGPAGAVGPVGPTGKEGLAGQAGKQGIEGLEGKEGKEGKEGSPWTAGGVLPKEKTEKGMWAFGTTANAAPAPQLVPISYVIPLATAIPAIECFNPASTECNIEVIDTEGKNESEEVSVNCTGSVAEPTAKAGFLCIYTTFENASSPAPFLYESNKSGAVVTFLAAEAGANARGAWAVTSK